MQSMPLAPVDYAFTGPMSCPVTFAFAYPKRLDPKRLEQGLTQLMAALPWIGGQLRARDEHSFSYEVGEQPKLPLEVTRSLKTFDELTGAEIVRVVKSTDGQPLVNARLTHTPSGSVLALSMSHALVDGFSFFLTMSKWAACARGESIEAPPSARLLRPSEEHVRAASEALAERTLLETSGLFWAEPRPEVKTLPDPHSLQMSGKEVDALMKRAQRDVSEKLRQNDVLTAWLWRTFGSQWWSASDDEDVYMSCPVDVRRLLGEENRAAFGCNICGASVRATWEELRRAPLGELALRIQRSVAAVFADDWQKRVAPLEALRRQHGASAAHRVHLRHPRRGMLVTNMSRLPLAELDFGTGAPVSVRLFAEIDSMAAVLPARDGVTINVFKPMSNVARLPLRNTTQRQARPSARAF